MSTKPKRLTKCICGREHDFDDYIWSIGVIKGYRSKTLICECGNEMNRLVPITEKLIALWNSLANGPQINPKDMK